MAPLSLSTFSPISPPAMPCFYSPFHTCVCQFQIRTNSTKIKCSASVSTSSSNPKVVVTRERGKNDKLVDALANHGIDCVELPLIQHTQLHEDIDNLSSVLRSNSFDWIIITSPESGLIFVDAWKSAGTPNVRVGVVGSGTAIVFDKQNLNVSFAPSKSSGKVLAAELPDLGSSSRCTVLYPASEIASNEIEEGLKNRGFEVTRINTYTTEPVSHVDDIVLEQALSAPVIAVASPSAILAWISLIPEPQQWDNAIVCIGETTALAAKRLGFRNVYFPENPGIHGWVNCILEALEKG